MPGVEPSPLPPTRHLVLGTGTLLIACQLGLRAWALFPSWFYADDFILLSQARQQGFSWSYVLDPYDNQFMPFGRSLVALVVWSGGASWTTAAAATLVVQALADAACLWMLVRVFGPRWRVLVPLALYLWLAVPLAGQMWWAASLNQLPLHLACFGSVGCWFTYARTRRVGWLVLTLAFVCAGLCAYVKSVLLFPVLAYLLVAYFSSGGPVRRSLEAVRRYWPALAAASALGGTFIVYFISNVPSLIREPAGSGVAGRLAETMLGTALVSGLLGGPWRWNDVNPPVVGAAPPNWAVHLSWVAVTLLIVGVALRRARTGRAWLLLTGYAGATFVLLLTTRATQVGELAGLQYRYLTDVVPIASLCLGLAIMEVPGAVEHSTSRKQPLLTIVPRTRWLVAAVCLVCASGVVSSVRYVLVWHRDNAVELYNHRVVDELRGRGPVDLPDQVVPVEAAPGVSFPYNTTKVMLPLLVDNARFPETSSRLQVLDDDGRLQQAAVDASTESLTGPDAGCGWKVDRGPTTVPLEVEAFNFDWWVRISYLGSGDDTMTVTIDGATRTVAVRRGANELFLHVTSRVPSVTLGGLTEGSAVCVETIEVGLPVPVGEDEE